MDRINALIALSRLKGFNRIQKRQVLEQYRSVAPLFEKAGAGGFRLSGGHFFSSREDDDISRERETLHRMGARILTIDDEGYPPQLRQIPDAPLVAYVKGPLRISGNTIAVVGSRIATAEGLNLAGKMAYALSATGITVVSGLARGIDSAAHTGALKGMGKTVAVLGCGIDVPYPAENRHLFEAISAEGVILTEYGLGEKPLGFHFPERNRIIAGLSRGIVVVEAARKSGSLITARLGLDYGREVMAVPGSVYREESRGTNALIKEGARLVDSVEEILSCSFPGFSLVKEKLIEIDDEEDYIYSFITYEKCHIEDIIEKSRRETRSVMAILTRLEMKNRIDRYPGGFYIRK